MKRKLYNDDFGGTSLGIKKTARSFPPFPQLSPELRLNIWRNSISRSRFVHVCVTSQADFGLIREDEVQHETYSSLNSLGNIISRYPYNFQITDGPDWPCSLLRVNREANNVFHSILRVQVPLQSGTLYLNPENDILHLEPSYTTSGLDIASFIHDVIAYDPKGIGMTRFSVGQKLNDMNIIVGLKPSLIPQPAVASITGWLTHGLRSLYSIVSPGVEGRNMLGVLSWPDAKIHQNCSMPVATCGTSAFSVLERDPRPIESDISHVAVGVDPRRTPYLWQKLEANFDVKREAPLVINYALSLWPRPSDPLVNDRASLVSFLDHADSRWSDWMKQLNKPPQGERLNDETFKTLQEGLKQVAGIWIFPADTFGPIPELDAEIGLDEWDIKLVKDLSTFHPALMVIDLKK
jgi:hypothetical protein